MAEQPDAGPTPARTEKERLHVIRLTATASLIGTTIEWYDFILYTSLSGLIFNKLFFPADNALVSLLLAYATFAVGFITRPIGGAFFGHFGDRIGRKPLLVLTLTLMGSVTFLIGLVPTYAQIGVAAPLLLVVLRLVQGFAMGGEWGGAVLMAYEMRHTSPRLLRQLPADRFALGAVPEHRCDHPAVRRAVERGVPSGLIPSSSPASPAAVRFFIRQTCS